MTKYSVIYDSRLHHKSVFVDWYYSKCFYGDWDYGQLGEKKICGYFSPSPVEALWTQQLMAHRSFSSSESWDRLVPLAVCPIVWVSLGCCGDSAPFRLHRTTMVPLKSTIASHTWPAHKRSYEPCSLVWRRVNNASIIMIISSNIKSIWNFIFHRHLCTSTYLPYAFSKSATQNALGLWHREKQRVSLIHGNRSSTRTSIQCPLRQNRNRNSPW